MNLKHDIEQKNKTQKYYIQDSSIYIHFKNYILQEFTHRQLNNKKSKGILIARSAQSYPLAKTEEYLGGEAS